MRFLFSDIHFSFQKEGRSAAYFIAYYQYCTYSAKSIIPSAADSKIQFTNLILAGGVANMGSHLSNYT